MIAKSLLAPVMALLMIAPLQSCEPPPPTPAEMEAQAFELMNQYRVANGRPALPRHAGLDADARGWSTVMSWYGTWVHSPNYVTDTVRHAPPGAVVCANENVGFTSTISTNSIPQLNHLFIQSPAHEANIMGRPSQTCGQDWNRVGVGVVQANGSTFITFRFARW